MATTIAWLSPTLRQKWTRTLYTRSGCVHFTLEVDAYTLRQSCPRPFQLTYVGYVSQLDHHTLAEVMIAAVANVCIYGIRKLVADNNPNKVNMFADNNPNKVIIVADNNPHNYFR